MTGKKCDFRLDEERDKDLINWLEGLGKGERSFYIRQALRQALRDREEDLGGGVVGKEAR